MRIGKGKREKGKGPSQNCTRVRGASVPLFHFPISLFRGFKATLIALLLLLVALPMAAQERAALGTGHGLPETIEAIERARVVTRVLYVTAHPDDESGSVLSYLARGAYADVALLSLTRGEGGQNALGPEMAPQLGLLRTEELLAACRIYGVKLYFGGAADFGSRTAVEDQLADRVGEMQELGDRQAAMKSGAVAFETADPVVEGHRTVGLRIEAAFVEELAGELALKIEFVLEEATARQLLQRVREQQPGVLYLCHTVEAGVL